MQKKKLSLYVFGTGEMAEIILPTFKPSMYDIIAFVVDTPNSCTQFMDRPVICVQDVKIEQCDFMLIICLNAKIVTKRLTRDHEIPKEKLVPIDIYALPSIQAIGENTLKEPLITLEMYLATFPGLFDIVDVDAFMSHPMLEAWLVRASNAIFSPPRAKMKTCSHLLGALNFEPSTIHPCCDTLCWRIPRGFYYKEGALNIIDYREYINEVFEELQYNTDLCEGCSLLVDTDESLSDLYKENFTIKQIYINPHRFFCNCKCIYCGLWQTPAPSLPYPIFDIIKDLINNGMLDKNCLFDWVGGEPTILREFEEVARFLFNKGFYQCILTNALQLSPIIVSLLEAGRCSLLISIDSGSKSMYKKIKGVNGWEKAISVCKTYCAHAAISESVHLKYIIFEKNNDIKEIFGFLNICIKIGVTRVVCSANFYDSRTKLTNQETVQAIAFFICYAKQIGLHCRHMFIFEPYLSQINELVAAMECPGSEAELEYRKLSALAAEASCCAE